MGEISFDVHVLRREGAGRAGEGALRGQASPRAPEPCLYQYPQHAQADALLSNMMNQLTKVFMRTHAYVEGAARAGAGAADNRFRVVERTQQRYFEKVYSNMTTDYSVLTRRFYNETTQRVNRAGLDPCDNQEEIKQQWRRLLARAQAGVAGAARACVRRMLAVRHRAGAGDDRTRNKVDQFLEKELSKVPANQLNLLCDNFQLCYNDLLEKKKDVQIKKD